MRFQFKYIPLAILGFSSTAAASSCWATSKGVTANWGTLNALRTDANLFCERFSNNNTAIVTSSGKYVFGYQSASFVGNFASVDSCLNTFNTLVTDCYGATNALVPNTLGGTITDAGGANLVLSFGTAVKL